MFDIKDQVDSDFLVSLWSFDLGVMTFINELAVVINLGDVLLFYLC
jgi:hypothetical protein